MLLQLKYREPNYTVTGVEWCRCAYLLHITGVCGIFLQLFPHVLSIFAVTDFFPSFTAQSTDSESDCETGWELQYGACVRISMLSEILALWMYRHVLHDAFDQRDFKRCDESFKEMKIQRQGHES